MPWRIRLCIIAVAFCVGASAAAQDSRRHESRDRSQEFVGFVQPDRLYWRPFTLSGVQSAEFKLLSMNDATGARTQLTKLPPGWKQAKGYHTHELEMFVLEGGLDLDGQRVGRYSYAYYPAGTAHAYGTEYGATVLQWWGGTPDFVRSAESRNRDGEAGTIEGWSYGDAPTIGLADFPKFRDQPVWENSPIRLKILRHDPDTGTMTWIRIVPGGGPSMSGEGALPLWKSSPGWVEGFLLAGDMTIAECLPVGQVAATYRQNGYFFRPAGIRHGGPSEYSAEYAIWLFRSGRQPWVDYHDSCNRPDSSTEQAGRP